MKTIKAEVIGSKLGEQLGFSVELEGKEGLHHFIPGTEIKKQSKYLELIKKNHPEYDFTPVEEPIVLMTPKTEFASSETIVEAKTDYQTKELTDAFEPSTDTLSTAQSKDFNVDDVADAIPDIVCVQRAEDQALYDAQLAEEFRIEKKKASIAKGKITRAINKIWDEAHEYNEAINWLNKPIPNNVDIETGEVTEDPHNNQNDMNKQTEASAEAPQVKVSIAKKAKWYGAVGLGVGVRTVTVPTHFGFQLVADGAQLIADGIRNVEAEAINGLRLSTATKQEIKDGIERRTRRMENIVIMPITIPVGIVKGIRQASKERAEQGSVQPVTA